MVPTDYVVTETIQRDPTNTTEGAVRKKAGDIKAMDLAPLREMR